jgi:type II secretory pathway pseudopilin PulG
MKTAIQITLTVAIIVLGYLLFESVMTPIRFNKERQIREDKTVQRLKDIRTAQIAFRSEYERYTGDFDTLITFLKTGHFTVVKAIGSAPDSLIEAMGKTEAEKIALKKGLIQRDTIQLSVIDSLFYTGYPVDSIRFVPYTNNYQFEMGAGELQTGSKVRVRVFEAKVPYDVLLKGLDPQLVINYSEEKEKITGYPGLKVGSLEEATNNAGNWE